MAIDMNKSYLVMGNLQPGTGTYNYKTNADGSIGVDYFWDGKPVSNQEFQAFTGSDVNAIEQAPYVQDAPMPGQEDTSYSGSSSSVTSLTLGNGSLSTPSLKFIGDVNTGLFLPASQQLGFVVANQLAGYFNSSGFTATNGISGGTFT